MTERDRWQGLVCARCHKAMGYERPLVAWDPDHAEGDDLALVPHPGILPGTVRAIVVHPECVGERE